MNKKIFIGIAIFWLVIILSFIVFKEFTLKTGQEVLFKTIPVDPRDLFRGDYVILNYEISTLDITSLPKDFSNIEVNDKIFVTLKKEKNYGIPTGIYKRLPENKLFIKGKIKDITNNKINIEFGIESYFVPEGKGREIERQRGENLEVKVAIDKFGNAIIKSLVIKGKEVNLEVN